MLHFLPDDAECPQVESRRDAFREGLGRALSIVEQIGGENSGPPRFYTSEPVPPEMEALIEDLGRRVTAASAAGLEVIAALSEEGLNANPAAMRLLADKLRDGLDSLGA